MLLTRIVIKRTKGKIKIKITRSMTYQETMEFLYGNLPAFHRIGKDAYKPDLGVTLALDEHLDHPHRKFASVHIAGTNGKGSVSHILASILQTAGYKTGLYTSPHLKDFRERIRVNGTMIPEDKVVRFVEENLDIFERIKPSFFEMSVGLAFDFFASENVDVAVIETGLGGRLDSTNIITPVLSVITNIGHDHMDILGDTLEKIAAEKAGIIKPGIPVIIGESKNETDDVFISKSRMLGSEILFADREYKCKMDPLDYSSGLRKFSAVRASKGKELTGYIPLGGDYEAKNIPTVILSAEKLSENFIITDEIILRGIENVIMNTGFAGRWQIIGQKPLTICDTGHNKEGIELVMSQLNNMEAKQKHFVIGFVSDKDVDSILPLFPRSGRYYFTKASVKRALDEKVLMNKASLYGINGESFGSVPEALDKARSRAGEDDIIFIGGSTFVVAEIL